MAVKPHCSSTRDKVLTTAAEVFAERGFRKTTVREIAARSGANLNAVNYYFGDKQGLYRAVLDSAQKIMAEDKDLLPAMDAAVTPEARLRAFVTSILKQAVTRPPVTHISRLIAMEMAEPSGALDVVIDNFIRPRFKLLTDIVRAIVGEEVSARVVDLCAESIIGQCVHLVHGRPITSRLMPYLTYAPEDLDWLADHVVKFSVNALARIGRTNGDTP